METNYELEVRMKEILEKTTMLVKHSATSLKKTKEKIVSYQSKELVPECAIKEWLDKRSLKYTFPDFFDSLFLEASRENRLDYTTKTIVFAEEDAYIFGFEVGVPISIFTLFEYIPQYFP